MTLEKDPERNESKYLHRLAGLAGKRVLEIGSGEGRMTWQYARGTRWTIGLDPDGDSLRVAKADSPFDLRNRAYFACAASDYLPFSRETFDIALLAWSF